MSGGVLVFKVFLPFDGSEPVRSSSESDFSAPETLPFYLNDADGNVHYYAATTDQIDLAVRAFEENRKVLATVQRWERDLETKD